MGRHPREGETSTCTGLSMSRWADFSLPMEIISSFPPMSNLKVYCQPAATPGRDPHTVFVVGYNEHFVAQTKKHLSSDLEALNRRIHVVW